MKHTTHQKLRQIRSHFQEVGIQFKRDLKVLAGLFTVAHSIVNHTQEVVCFWDIRSQFQNLDKLISCPRQIPLLEGLIGSIVGSLDRALCRQQ